MIGGILSLIASIIGWFTGRKEAAGVAQGRAEERASSDEAGIAVINRANVAAKKVETQKGADPNDLDR
jgi:hypothetical protein